jgi:hypothetical protein
MLRDLPSGSKIVKLTIETEPKLLKLNRVTGEPCPIERLFKRSTLNVLLGSSYTAAVNKQLERSGEEPNFEARLLWRGEGEHVEGSPFLVRKKGSDKHYLAFRLLNVVSEVYHLGDGGPAVDPAKYKNFLPLPPKGEPQEVVWRTVSLENVRSVIYADKEWL